VIRAVLLAALALAAVACGSSTSTVPPGPTPAPGSLVSPVEGVPVHIDAEGFTKVTGFTVREDDGTLATFAMGTLENGDQFPPNHLAEHLAGGTRIRVFFRDENGTPTAYRIEDVLP
jgi:hypothetical protein